MIHHAAKLLHGLLNSVLKCLLHGPAFFPHVTYVTDTQKKHIILVPLFGTKTGGGLLGQKLFCFIVKNIHGNRVTVSNSFGLYLKNLPFMLESFHQLSLLSPDV